MNLARKSQDSDTDDCRIELSALEPRERWEVIGSGGQGVVYKAEYEEFMDVALKELRPTDQDGIPFRGRELAAAHDAFRKELAMLKKLRLPNIVQLLGCIIDQPDGFYIVMEFMQGGSLYRCIRDRPLTFKWGDGGLGLKMALDTCTGLCYLHTLRPPLVHFDVKTSNILVSKDNVAKLSDVGLSKVLVTTHTNPSGWTLAYAAPEILEGRGGSPKSDVYSFGVVLCVIYSQQEPFPQSCASFEQSVNDVALKRLVESCLTKRCWLRPDSKSVLKALKGFAPHGTAPADGEFEPSIGSMPVEISERFLGSCPRTLPSTFDGSAVLQTLEVSGPQAREQGFSDTLFGYVCWHLLFRILRLARQGIWCCFAALTLCILFRTLWPFIRPQVAGGSHDTPAHLVPDHPGAEGHSNGSRTTTTSVRSSTATTTGRQTTTSLAPDVPLHPGGWCATPGLVTNLAGVLSNRCEDCFGPRLHYLDAIIENVSLLTRTSMSKGVEAPAWVLGLQGPSGVDKRQVLRDFAELVARNASAKLIWLLDGRSTDRLLIGFRDIYRELFPETRVSSRLTPSQLGFLQAELSGCGRWLLLMVSLGTIAMRDLPTLLPHSGGVLFSTELIGASEPAVPLIKIQNPTKEEAAAWLVEYAAAGHPRGPEREAAAKVAMQLPRPASLRCIVMMMKEMPNVFVLAASTAGCRSALQCLALDGDAVSNPLKQLKGACRDIVPEIEETHEGVMARPTRLSSLRPLE